MRIGSGSKLEQHGVVKAHSQGASQAHFINFFSHPYWLISGGNDSHVNLWDLNKHPVVAPEEKNKSQTKGIAPRRKNGKSKAKCKEVEAKKREAGDDDQAAAEVVESMDISGPKLSINHGEKVNWLCPAELKGEPSVVVADQSSSLTVYSLFPK